LCFEAVVEALMEKVFLRGVYPLGNHVCEVEGIEVLYLRGDGCTEG
jgi:hypothetical protein